MAKVKVKYIGHVDRVNTKGLWKPQEVKEMTPEEAEPFVKSAKFEVSGMPEKGEKSGNTPPPPPPPPIVSDEVPEDHEFHDLGVEGLKEVIRNFKGTPGRGFRKPQLLKQAYLLSQKEENDE